MERAAVKAARQATRKEARVRHTGHIVFIRIY
jgi:hypothetical protein